LLDVYASFRAANEVHPAPAPITGTTTVDRPAGPATEPEGN
jgi:hypothetical protein